MILSSLLYHLLEFTIGVVNCYGRKHTDLQFHGSTVNPSGFTARRQQVGGFETSIYRLVGVNLSHLTISLPSTDGSLPDVLKIRSHHLLCGLCSEPSDLALSSGQIRSFLKGQTSFLKGWTSFLKGQTSFVTTTAPPPGKIFNPWKLLITVG